MTDKPDKPAVLDVYADLGLRKIHQTTVHSLLGICAHRFELYKKHGPRPPGIAAHVGTGLHKGAAHNFRQKIGSGKDLKVGEIEEVSVTAYQQRLKDEGVHLLPEEKDGKVELLKDGEKRVRKFAEVFTSDLAPDIQPELVEYEFSVPAKGLNIELVGTMDLRDDKNWILDLKTAGKKKTQRDADTSDQLTTYSFAHELEGRGKPDGLGLDVLVCSEKKMKCSRQERLASERTDEHYNQLLKKISFVLRMLEAGLFPPNTMSWLCSRKWCGYFDICPYPYK